VRTCTAAKLCQYFLKQKLKLFYGLLT